MMSSMYWLLACFCGVERLFGRCPFGPVDKISYHTIQRELYESVLAMIIASVMISHLRTQRQTDVGPNFREGLD